jgi:hypothetical protein
VGTAINGPVEAFLSSCWTLGYRDLTEAGEKDNGAVGDAL